MVFKAHESSLLSPNQMEFCLTRPLLVPNTDKQKAMFFVIILLYLAFPPVPDEPQPSRFLVMLVLWMLIWLVNCVLMLIQGD